MDLSPTAASPGAAEGAISSVTYLAELSWTEARERLSPETIALLPIGSTEAHGPHLPLATDVIISEGMARRAAQRLATRGIPVLILPTLPYGVTEFARSFAGTLGIGPETFRRVLEDIARALMKQGIRTLCLVNSHLEPEHVQVMRTLTGASGSEELPRILFPDKTRRRWVGRLPEEFQKGECHAGAYESSMLLAEAPGQVRESIRRMLDPVPINLTEAMQRGIDSFEGAGANWAYFGRPAEATAEAGEAIFEILTEMIVTTILEERDPV